MKLTMKKLDSILDKISEDYASGKINCGAADYIVKSTFFEEMFKRINKYDYEEKEVVTYFDKVFKTNYL